MKKLVNKTSNWLPDYYAASTANINFDHLLKTGIRVCFFDLDHTILVHGTAVVDKHTLKILKSIDADIFIATNRKHSPDLGVISKQIGAKGIVHAEADGTAKPSRLYYQKMIKVAGVKPKHIAMIGDRLIQDVWGANRSGITTVMVAKFGKIHWFDFPLTIQDQLIPVVFKRSYKDL